MIPSSSGNNQVSESEREQTFGDAVCKLRNSGVLPGNGKASSSSGGGGYLSNARRSKRPVLVITLYLLAAATLAVTLSSAASR